MALRTVTVLLAAGALWLLLRSGSAGHGRGATPASASRHGVDPAYAHYAGDASCRNCHPGEYAAHTTSGHSKTLRPAARVAHRRHWHGLTAEDPERPGVVWTYGLSDDRFWTERAEPGAVAAADRSAAERFVIDYAFGSGRHATTLVSLRDRQPSRPIIREHRLTFFAHSGSFGLTPGQSLSGHAGGNTQSGRIHSADDTLKCFGCHATATSDRGPDVLDEATMIPNVTCERCHGPARSHVAAARRGAGEGELRMPFGLEGATVDDQLRLCGSCHRTPEMVTPGHIRTDNPVVVRYQPVGLVQSACYKGSGHSLGCTTCHDPHARTSTDRAAYEVTCRSCHAERRVTPCPISAQSGCVACHMPRRDVARGMIMTDHWIRVIPAAMPRAAPSHGLPQETVKGSIED